MLLRFEFMGRTVAKVVATFSTLALCAMVWMMMSDVFA
jgi:hypothetical protein